MKIINDQQQQRAIKQAEELFKEALKNGRFVATVSMVVEGNIHHATVRSNFPAGNLDASLNHVESSYYGMGMTRNEERMRVPEGPAEAGSVPMPAVRPVLPAT